MKKITYSKKDIELQRQIDRDAVIRRSCESRADTVELANEVATRQAKTAAQRQQKFRKGKRESGRDEVRGIFSRPENHRAIKCFAEALEIGFIKAIKAGVTKCK